MTAGTPGSTGRSRRVSLCFTWLVTFAIICSLAGCRSGGTARSKSASCCATNQESPITVSERSLYQIDSVWTTDSEQQIKLGSLQGRVQVITMFFTSCQASCPLLVHQMKLIEAALPETLRSQTGFVLATFDPQRDTPKVLRDYRARLQLPADRWTLLRAAPDDILELAALLGVKYKQDARGQFAHSNLITVLNPQGEIVHQQMGLGQDLSQTAKAIERAAGPAQVDVTK